MKKYMRTTVTIMVLMAVMLASGCKPEDDGHSYKGHEYVDLGLPSGTLWATCNVGSDIPQGVGYYFAWAETSQKTDNGWSTYKYCKTDFHQLIKYCSISDYGYNGFTDDLSVLQQCDDAATENWGSGWCTPSKGQWEELCLYSNRIWTIQDGMNGFLLTGPNGRNLFLPATGLRVGSTHVGEWGRYWSSSLNLDRPAEAWCLAFQGVGFSEFKIESDGRDNTFTVRPVRSEH